MLTFLALVILTQKLRSQSRVRMLMRPAYSKHPRLFVKGSGERQGLENVLDHTCEKLFNDEGHESFLRPAS